MDQLLKIVQTINAYTADYILIVLLVGVGIYYTIRTRFVQIRCFGEGAKNVFGNFSLRGGKQKGGGMSSFQALATAIAAQVGTGNIVGACGAILLGGPGAIFWMWIIAFLGMATNYGEAVLAQKTRVVDENGEVSGGPVYYMKSVFKGTFGKILAGFFAIATVLALGFMGSMVQSNSIGAAFNTAFGIPSWIIGIIVAVLAAIIFIGGVSRIASVTEKLVPIMAGLYLIGGLIVIICRIQYIPETFGMIFKYAFMPQSLAGGLFGATIAKAISQGAKRGLFSNEAGMGSTPHAHAMANVKTAHEQGTTAIIAVFIDTFVVLTITAIIAISTLYAGNGVLANGPVEGIDKTNMIQIAMGNIFSIFMGNNIGAKVGAIFVAICLAFFAFSTIVSWNLFGKINYQYLFGKGKAATTIYSVIAIGFIFLGSLLSNDLVWELTDLFNYLMVFPNAIAMIALGNVVAKEAQRAREEKRRK